MTASLTVDRLTVRLGAVSILKELSLEARSRNVLAVIGPPGAGKTALLKTMAGLWDATDGRIVLEHRSDVFELDSSTRAEWHRRVGMAFQNDALFDALTVYENVAFPLRRRAVDPREIDERVRQLLDQVGLQDAAQRLPAEISGGMRKRCGIARAVVSKPVIGLFDDPTAGLDPETSDSIFELIVEQSRTLSGICVVVSNDLPSLLAVAKDVCVLHEGRLLFHGSPDAVAACEEPVVHQFVRGAADGPL
ncbi:MAG: ATP-binding cassette domain-containing protein [Myxococcota bacterium]